MPKAYQFYSACTRSVLSASPPQAQNFFLELCQVETLDSCLITATTSNNKRHRRQRLTNSPSLVSFCACFLSKCWVWLCVQLLTGRSERAVERCRSRAATFGKNSAKRICATLLRVTRSSDAHRERATTTDFAKPSDARQFWRVAGLARFSNRAELKNVLRLVEGGCVDVGRSV